MSGIVLVLDSVFDADGIDAISFLISEFSVHYDLIVNGTRVRGEPRQLLRPAASVMNHRPRLRRRLIWNQFPKQIGRPNTQHRTQDDADCGNAQKPKAATTKPLQSLMSRRGGGC